MCLFWEHIHCACAAYLCNSEKSIDQLSAVTSTDRQLLLQQSDSWKAARWIPMPSCSIAANEELVFILLLLKWFLLIAYLTA